ncbi:MAG: ABC transporter ATP-binding protein, partial [Melioribacteraceae bacterium]|nr:ABC transporter ATP-binding protein [Melioribacteraceae bacterium]
GYSIAKDPNNVKRNIGYMSQRFSLYNDLAVGENIDFFGGVYGLEGKEFEERKKWVLETANLQDRENVLTGSLPGGIKQRLALGTAVIHKPSIVFLDEPTSGVDPISRRSFWDLIHDLSEQGVTVFVTTHYLEEAEYCNNIILIDSGELIAEGSSKELKSKYINHKIIEIECSNVIMALDILDKEKFVIDTSIFGNTIHVSVAENEDYITLIRKALENEKKVKIKRMSEITPTLEDVFIHLLEERKNAV